jgi:hypothetical protein
MKKSFGQKFKSYEPFQIEHLALPSVNTKFLKKYNIKVNGLSEVAPLRTAPGMQFRRAAKIRPLKVVGRSASLDRIKKELARVVVAVAPSANVYQIPRGQPDLAVSIKNTLSEFDYYVVELGLNVMLGRQFKIPELLLNVKLINDAEKTDVTVYDMAPDDKIKKIKAISGKVSLGVSKFLKLIPSSVGQVAANLIDIEINPWEFEWNIKKYMIDACGEKNYNLYWKIYQTEMVQSFNPTLILKVRKNVKKITAQAKCIYKLKTNWWNFAPDIKTDSQEIKILI